jgi:hypothetical protein
MSGVTKNHFERAVVDVSSHGDNDTLPFDTDNRFLASNQAELSTLAYNCFKQINSGGKKSSIASIDSLPVFSERLLTPTGPAGFRVTTKIHPFWNIYLNGLGTFIAETLEPLRASTAHSYRYSTEGKALFDRTRSWRAYREATLADNALTQKGAIVVQTDISSFYEHIYHHRIENCLERLLPIESTVPAQVDRLLNKLSSGRSFGLPVGGQCARVLAEVLMSEVDRALTDEGIVWHRYVDDFTLITSNQAEAYKALSILSHTLADYGLSLNRTKTTILSATHYKNYALAQLGSTTDETSKLREINLHYDPYSDNAVSDYEDLRETVEQLEVQTLLDLELQKGQPDSFLVSQIGRTLKLHNPQTALQLCRTLLTPKNLHSFRASWATIMRGIASVRANKDNTEIFSDLDSLIDQVSIHSLHLLLPEGSCLHYLKTIRFDRTQMRATYVLKVYSSTSSETVKQACIECWKQWGDSTSFTRLRNKWGSMQMEEQRFFWLASTVFGDEGTHFRNQVRKSLPNIWKLGFEKKSGDITFGSLYTKWSEQ